MIPVPAVTTDWDRFFYFIRPAPEKRRQKNEEKTGSDHHSSGNGNVFVRVRSVS